MGLSSNKPTSGTNPFTWEQFDRLPQQLRQVMAFAQVQLGTERATQNLRRGMSVVNACRVEGRVAYEAAQRMLREHYGPDHPRLRSQGE